MEKPWAAVPGQRREIEVGGRHAERGKMFKPGGKEWLREGMIH